MARSTLDRQLPSNERPGSANSGQTSTIAYGSDMSTIDIETAWIGSLTLDQKVRFLARLSFEITIAGRTSYEAGTDGLTYPRQLRRTNEIQHRVTACLFQLLTGTCSEGFDLSIPEWVLTEPDVELDGMLKRAWAEAKRRIQAG